MLNDNIRNLRKTKGMSQEELAIKLNVVRQTISKWEKGLSVPDSGMLIRISEELDTSVNTLLGEEVPVCEENELKRIATKLELLNEQFAKRNESHRKILRIVFIIVCIVTFGVLFVDVVSLMRYFSIVQNLDENISTFGGVDEPTRVFVSNASMKIAPLIATILGCIIGVIGVLKTKKGE